MKLGRFLYRIFVSALKSSRHTAPLKRRPVYLAPDTSPNELVRVKVCHVYDGDTVLVATPNEKICIRLSAIDCPEDGQPWANKAKSHLIRLIGGRVVHLETHGFDIHGRTLATVFVKNGSELINVNEKMVVCGHAWVMRVYYSHLSKSRQIQLNTLEKWAKSKKVGLWKMKDPVPPWQWRKSG